MRRFPRGIAWVAIPACIGLSSSCTPAGDGAHASYQPLTVEDVSVAERTDVRRNESVLLDFGRDIDPLSVNSETIRIAPEPLFDEPIPGRFLVKGHQVLFQPARLPGEEPEEAEVGPVGFRENTRYRIDVPGSLRLSTVMTRHGQGMDEDFSAYFRTNDRFLADATPPQVDDPQAPLSLSEISVQFSEAMDPRSFMGADRFAVTDAAGRRVAGRLRFDPSLARVTFEPESDERDALAAGLRYFVTVSDKVTDLAGNALSNAGVREVPVSGAIEAFHEDGLALGRAGSKRDAPQTQPEGDRALLGREPTHTMVLFTREEIGPSGTLLGLFLGLSEEMANEAVYGSFEIALFATAADRLEPDLRENLPAEGRTVVKREHFFVVSRCDGHYLPISFDTPFAYDGRQNLVVEILHTGGSARNPLRLVRPGGPLPRRVMSPLAERFAHTVDVLPYDIVFQVTRKGNDVETRWHSVGDPEPRYLEAGLFGSSPYPQDYVLVEYEGTQRLDEFERPIGGTGFVTDPERLNGYPFVRVRVTALADLPGEGLHLPDSIVLRILPPR